MKKGKSTILDRAFKEVFDKPPAITKSTAKKFGKKRARKQQIAIAFAKSRRAGGPG